MTQLTNQTWPWFEPSPLIAPDMHNLTILPGLLQLPLDGKLIHDLRQHPPFHRISSWV